MGGGTHSGVPNKTRANSLDLTAQAVLEFTAASHRLPNTSGQVQPTRSLGRCPSQHPHQSSPPHNLLAHSRSSPGLGTSLVRGFRLTSTQQLPSACSGRGPNPLAPGHSLPMATRVHRGGRRRAARSRGILASESWTRPSWPFRTPSAHFIPHRLTFQPS